MRRVQDITLEAFFPVLSQKVVKVNIKEGYLLFGKVLFFQKLQNKDAVLQYYRF